MKKPEKIRTLILTRTYEAAVRFGAIDPSNKTEEEIAQEFERYYESLAKDNGGFFIVIDHSRDLLEQARHIAGKGKYTISALFYATWFEHWFNELTSAFGTRIGLNEDEIIQVIKDVPLRAKLTWLLRVFGLKPIHYTHRNAILKMFDLRNGFVHYKWKWRNVDHESQEDKDLEVAVSTIEKTITYLNNYQRKYVFKQRKKVVRKVAKNKATEIENAPDTAV
jgi:hypothetical protein